MMERRMEELEKKISGLEQWNSSLESKVSHLVAEIAKLKKETSEKEISPNTAVTVNEVDVKKLAENLNQSLSKSKRSLSTW